jgi:hypothetical protein
MEETHAAGQDLNWLSGKGGQGLLRLLLRCMAYGADGAPQYTTNQQNILHGGPATLLPRLALLH